MNHNPQPVPASPGSVMPHAALTHRLSGKLARAGGGEERAMTTQEVNAKAAQMWQMFDKNQKTAVRIGMFPAGPMQEAGKLGYDGQALAVALMNCASGNGGMIA